MQTRTTVTVIVVLLTIMIFGLWGACGEQAVGPETSFPKEGIHVRGAMYRVIDERNTICLDATGDPSVLGFRIGGRGTIREQKEYASLMAGISLPRGSSGWEKGEYTFEKGWVDEPGHVEGYFFVTIHEDTKAEEYYGFELTSLYLKIERNDGEAITGGYSFLGSTDHYRREDRGRVRFVPIEGDGQINILGTIDSILIPEPSYPGTDSREW